MKNGLLIWNVLLTLIVGYLLITHFSSKKSNTTSVKTTDTDTARINKEFRIAYFEMDSVEANFDMVKDVKAEISKKEDAINSELEGLSRKFQQRYNYFEGQATSGNMNQAQRDAASQELKNMEEQMKARKQTLDQEYSDLTVKKMKDIKSKIEDFLKEYNANRNYSYIVSYEQGLFYYKDTVYNITDDVVRGLNSQYKSSRKQ